MLIGLTLCLIGAILGACLLIYELYWCRCRRCSKWVGEYNWYLIDGDIVCLDCLDNATQIPQR